SAFFGAFLMAGYAAGLVAGYFTCAFLPQTQLWLTLASAVIFLALIPSPSVAQNTKPVRVFPRGETIALLMAGAAFGLGIVGALRAFSMFQPPSQLADTTGLLAMAVFLLIGLFLARTNFSRGFLVLNVILRLLRRKPAAASPDVKAFMWNSLLLLSLGFAATCAATETMSVLSDNLTKAVPQDSVAALLFVIFFKASLFFGPCVMAFACFVTSSASFGEDGILLFFLGCAAGAAGFLLLLPVFGVMGAVYIATVALLTLGLWGIASRHVFFEPPFLLRISVVLLLGVLLLTTINSKATLAQRTLLFTKSGIDIKYTMEDVSAILTVAKVEKEDPDLAHIDLFEDAVYLGGISVENRYLKLAAFMPAFYGVSPVTSALVLGYDTGVGAGALRRAVGKNAIITVVDRCPGKFNMQKFFEPDCELVLNDPNTVEAPIAPLLYVRSSLANSFQAILISPRPVGIGEDWRIYDRDSIARIAAALSPGGLLIAPLGSLNEGEFRAIADNFASVMRTDVYFFRGGPILVGVKSPKDADRRLDAAAIAAQLVGDNRDFLRKLNVNVPSDVFAGFIAMWQVSPNSPSLPCEVVSSEWSLVSGTAKQGNLLRLLLPLRSIEMSRPVTRGFDTPEAERFFNSGAEVLAGIAEYLAPQNKDGQNKAGESFVRASSLNRGDYEAVWFLKYLEKVGLVQVEPPKTAEKELGKILTVIQTSSDNRERTIALVKLMSYIDSISVQDVVYLINDTDSSIRRLAVQILGYFDDAVSRQAVIKMISDPDDNVALEAVNAAVRQNNSAAMDALLELLAKNRAVAATIAALSKLGGARASGVIAARLPGPTETDTLQLLGALERCGTPEQYAAIKSLMASSSELVRERAILALRKIATRFADKLTLREFFIAGLSDKVLWVRAQAVDALGDVGDASTVPALEKIFDLTASTADENTVVLNQRVLRAIGSCGGEEAIRFLRERATDQDPRMVMCATSSLGLTKSAAARTILEKLAEQGQRHEREAALEGLFYFGESAEEAIAGYADDPDKYIAFCAVKYVASLRTQSAVARLRNWMGNRDMDIVQAAAENAYLTRERELCEPLFDLLNKGNSKVVDSACSSIVRLSDQRVISRYCRSALGHSVAQVKASAAAALKYLPSDIEKGPLIVSLIEGMPGSQPLLVLIEFTAALARLTGEKDPRLVVKRNSTEEEVLQAVRMWQDWVKRAAFREKQ
ncbi:MAG: HEAT repeat domain-containing protein, partial [Candidatus Brocadiia bacterium]